MTRAGCCAFRLNIGAIDGDARSTVVRSGTIAVAGPKVFGGSNKLERNGSQCLISKICWNMLGKAK